MQTASSAYYKDSHHGLRAYVRAFVERELLPHCFEYEANGVSDDLYKRFADANLLLPHLPPNLRGGRPHPIVPVGEWDAFHSLVVSEEMCRVPTTGVQWYCTAGTALGCGPILHFGTNEQRERFLIPATQGAARFCLGVTEPEGGSDVASLRTTAKLNSNGTHYIVSGSKKWITVAPWADFMTTAVRTGTPESGPKGLSFLIIPLRLPGVRIRRLHTSGLNGSGSALVTLDEVQVPAENLIGKPGSGFNMIMANFNNERSNLATNALALARICADDAKAHAFRRKTFGKPLVENQLIRAKLASMERGIESTHAWLEQLTYEVQVNPHALHDSALGAKFALLKVQAGKVLEHCCREAQQIFGGLGMTKEGHGKNVEQISREVRVFVVGGGSEEMLDDVAIRILATRPKL